MRPNKRMSHEGEVPNIGGLNICFSFLLTYLFFNPTDPINRGSGCGNHRGSPAPIHRPAPPVSSAVPASASLTGRECPGLYRSTDPLQLSSRYPRNPLGSYKVYRVAPFSRLNINEKPNSTEDELNDINSDNPLITVR